MILLFNRILECVRRVVYNLLKRRLSYYFPSSSSKTAEKVVQDLINDVIPNLPIEPDLCKNYNQLHGCLITIKNAIDILNEGPMNAPKEEKYTLFQVINLA